MFEAELVLKSTETESRLAREAKETESRLAIEAREAEMRILQVESGLQIEKQEMAMKARSLEQDFALKQQQIESQKREHEMDWQSKEKLHNLEMKNREQIANVQSLEKLEAVKITSEVTQSSSTTSIQNSGLKHYSKLLDLPFLKSETRLDIDAYLTKFKRLCLLNEVPYEFHGKLLANKLGGALIEIFNRIPIEKARDFKTIEAALLQKFLLNSDYYSQQFKEITPNVGESTAEYFRRLSEIVEKWMNLQKTENTAEAVKEFFLIDQYVNTLKQANKSKLLFIRERLNGKDFNIQSISEISDVCDASRSMFKTGPNKLSYNKNFVKFNQSNGKNEVNFDSKEKNERLCNFCNKSGHTENFCFKKRDGKKPVELESGNKSYKAHPANLNSKSGNKSKPKTHTAAVKSVCFIEDKPLIFENSNHLTEIESETESEQSDDSDDDVTKLKQEALPQICATKSKFFSRSQDRSATVLDPYSTGFINGRSAQIMRDTGSAETIVKEKFVLPYQFTGKKVKATLANNSEIIAGTAYVYLKTEYFSGREHALVFKDLITDCILGNRPHVSAPIKTRRIKIPTDKIVRNNRSVEQNEIFLKMIKM